VRETREKVERLRTEIADLEAAEAAQADALRTQLRSAWLLSRRSPMQMLLEAETPDRVGRLLWFSRHTSEARSELVADWRRARSDLAEREAELGGALVELEADRDALRARAARLAATRDERGALLADLERRIAARRDNVVELRATRAELAALLERLIAEAGTLTGTAFETGAGPAALARPAAHPPGLRPPAAPR